ncbi:hypothetical protein LTS15_005040 [Exophiala xenobiotica]|nr:hypothetical protein LTS15_005040 [Exophiala xenobiotica]
MASHDRNTVYVVLGANKGIGLGLVQTLLVRPRATIIATVRPGAPVMSLSEACSKISYGEGTKLHPLAVNASTSTETSALRTLLDQEIGPKVDHVDVLISSIGYTDVKKPVLETSPQSMREHFEVNTITPMTWLQAFWPLMVAPMEESVAAAPTKIFFLSSSVGCVGEWMEPMPGGAYGPAKAALNWVVRKLHFELVKEGMINVAVHPG